MSGAGREAIVFTTCYVMQWGAKAGHTVGIWNMGDIFPSYLSACDQIDDSATSGKQ